VPGKVCTVVPAKWFPDHLAPGLPIPPQNAGHRPSRDDRPAPGAVITHRRAADAGKQMAPALPAPGQHHRLPSRRPHQLSVMPPPHSFRAGPGVARPGHGAALLLTAGHTRVVTADQLEMISADPRVMQARP
jgi:hypothetical protein